MREQAKSASKTQARGAGRGTGSRAGQTISGNVDPSGTPGKRSRRSRATVSADFKTSVLNIRVSDQLKDEAVRILDEIGISLPEAVRVFLSRVVRDRGFPFRLEVPNADTAASVEESRKSEMGRFATAEDLFDALEKGAVR